MDEVTSQNVMLVDGQEMPGKGLKKMVLESLPESRRRGDG